MTEQKKRAHKESKGERKSSRRVKLTGVQKILLGGGMLARVKPIGGDRKWSQCARSMGRSSWSDF